VSGRSLGRLVGRERVVVVAFAEEEEYRIRDLLGGDKPTSLIVSGGCDKVVRVWDVETGYGGCAGCPRDHF
jgi:WD40 repeat protein